MPDWRRDTPWRQGQFLCDRARTVFFPQAGEVGFDSVLVISHNCDLASLPEREPHVELILAKRIERLDGNFTHSKNPRRLHLTASGGSEALHFELSALEKKIVAKKELADYAPDENSLLAANELIILQEWLAARYRRAAFPDEFDSRLNEHKLKKQIAEILEPLGATVFALLCDLDEGAEVERRGEDDLYQLRLYILYDDDGSDDIIASIEEAAQELSQIFQDQFFDSTKNCWRNIELAECAVLSSNAMSVAQSQRLKRWSMDYISLRADPQQPLVQ